MRSKAAHRDDNLESALRRMLSQIGEHRETMAGGRVETIMKLFRLSVSKERTIKARERNQAWEALQLMLERYRWTARTAAPGSSQVFYIATVQEDLSVDEAWEHWAVSLILRALNETGMAQRLRECQNENCEHRLFLAAANKPEQRFCQQSCRLKVYAADPLMQEKHRLLVNRRYYEEKELNAKAKQQAEREIANAKKDSRKRGR